jgi:hypothetical protein
MQPARVALVIGALLIIFNGLIRSDDHMLSALTVMSIVLVVAWYYLRNSDAADEKTQKDIRSKFEADEKERKETAFPGATLLTPSFPKKGLKFLLENAQFVEIAEDIRVLRLVDKAKYGDILVLMNQLQKTYMYILAGRYDPAQYIGIFMDTRDALLQHFYSCIFVLPTVFTHVYGIDPTDLIERNTNRMTAVTRKMIEVLKSYAEKTAKIGHIPDVAQIPAPNDFADPTYKMRLP